MTTTPVSPHRPFPASRSPAGRPRIRRPNETAKGRSTITSNISAAQIVGDTLNLDLEGVIDDPVLRRMADCVRELRPTVDRNIARHGHGTTLAALVAIVANGAIDAGSGRLIADAFRHNAEMLEFHEALGAVAGHA
jgi:hypothetical protein